MYSLRDLDASQTSQSLRLRLMPNSSALASPKAAHAQPLVKLSGPSIEYEPLTGSYHVYMYSEVSLGYPGSILVRHRSEINLLMWSSTSGAILTPAQFQGFVLGSPWRHTT